MVIGQDVVVIGEWLHPFHAHRVVAPTALHVALVVRVDNDGVVIPESPHAVEVGDMGNILFDNGGKRPMNRTILGHHHHPVLETDVGRDLEVACGA
jgi:hypothetical protein